MDISDCTYRDEVVAALLRRAPLRIPATGFGFHGPGTSYKTSHAAPLPGFRIDDLVTIRDHRGGPRALTFEYTDGATPTCDGLVVALAAGDWVSYDVYVPSATTLAATVALDGTPMPDAGDALLAVSIGGVSAHVKQRDGTMTSTAPVTAGRHAVRVECLGGETSIRWLDIGAT